jgi:prophage regulatory protein
MSQTLLPIDRIIGSKERRRIIPYSDMHVSRLEKVGAFPKRIKLGSRRVGWSLLEIEQWIKDRKTARVDMGGAR